jgi:chromatin segregation and condensation protein Rec8/ScpA/Scc1 (kleisin family)
MSQRASAMDRERLERIVRVQSEIDQAERSIRHLIAAIREAGHSPSMIADLGEQEALHEGLRAKLFELQAQAPPEPKRVDIGDLARALIPMLEAASPEQLRLLFRHMLVEVRAERQGEALLGEIAYRIEDVEGCLPL